MSSQKPDITALKLSEFFQSTYQVPRYQRNYNWTDKHITQLMEDLFRFFNSSEKYYLLGTVIAGSTDSEEYEYELVDGQQRATTLMCLFAILYMRNKNLGVGTLATGPLMNALIDSSDKQIIRVKMSGDASKILFSYIEDQIEDKKNETSIAQTSSSTSKKNWHKQNLEYLSKTTNHIKPKSLSQSNLISALEKISQIIHSKLGDDKDLIRKFERRILSDVYLGRVTLGSVDQAATFFERVNDRGLRLTSADLLKNRLLQHIKDDDDYQAASETWESADLHLFSAERQSSMTYLIRMIRQAETGEKVKENDVYSSTKETVRNDEESKDFIFKIKENYPALINILGGKTPRGEIDSESFGTSFFNHVQNHCIKLAARKLNHSTYLHLSKRLESRAILSLIADEIPSRYEKIVPKIAAEILKLDETASNDDVDKALGLDSEQINTLFQIAYSQFYEYRYQGSPKTMQRLRYVLARCNDEVFPKEKAGLLWDLHKYLQTSKTVRNRRSEGFDIEHIEAQAITDDVKQNNSIGNLTLLYWVHNATAGKDEPAEKQPLYKVSHCYLTRALTSSEELKAEFPDIDKYRVAVIDDGDAWNQEKIDARTQLYFTIFFDSLSRDLGIKRPQPNTLNQNTIDDIQLIDVE